MEFDKKFKKSEIPIKKKVSFREKIESSGDISCDNSMEFENEAKYILDAKLKEDPEF